MSNPFDDYKPTERDWIKDFPHENGCYLNTCCSCELQFMGHKRKVKCLKCYLIDSGEAFKNNDKRIADLEAQLAEHEKQYRDMLKPWIERVERRDATITRVNAQLAEKDRVVQLVRNAIESDRDALEVHHIIEGLLEDKAKEGS